MKKADRRRCENCGKRRAVRYYGFFTYFCSLACANEYRRGEGLPEVNKENNEQNAEVTP